MRFALSIDPNLRQLIISKCLAKGISVEHLSQVTDCSLTELKGYKEGLLILGTDKLINLIRVLAISDEELVAAVGTTTAAELIKLRGSSSA